MKRENMAIVKMGKSSFRLGNISRNDEGFLTIYLKKLGTWVSPVFPDSYSARGEILTMEAEEERQKALYDKEMEAREAAKQTADKIKSGEFDAMGAFLEVPK